MRGFFLQAEASSVRGGHKPKLMVATAAAASLAALPRGAIMTEEVKAEHSPSEHTLSEHAHGGTDCSHETVQHGDHVDYLHDGHRHAQHEDHYDEH